MNENDIRVAKPESLKESSEETSTGPIVIAETTPADSHSDEKSEEFGKGIVFYLKNEKIVGVLLWNLFGRTPIAQRIIREGRSAEDIKSLAREFRLYADEEH